MNDIYQSILRLKNKLLINYVPEEISYLAMEILNKGLRKQNHSI